VRRFRLLGGLRAHNHRNRRCSVVWTDPANGLPVVLVRASQDELSFDMLAAYCHLFACAGSVAPDLERHGIDPAEAANRLPDLVRAIQNFALGRKEARECEREMVALLRDIALRPVPADGDGRTDA